ncbi:MAG: hypothetical protein KDD47_09575, partial [Acidobacteria bacterium]|nr:hypothetical protein [Acidobacteriota bacterium]
MTTVYARRSLSLPALLALVALLSACAEEGDGADAYGNFEATEVRISAEVGGRLLDLAAEEGMDLGEGAEAGRVETTALELEKVQAEASRQA